MLENGGQNPKNYIWQSTAKRILCFDETGLLIFDVRIPKTMREALLLGYLEGWRFGDTVNQNYIEMLEGLCGERLPTPMNLEDGEMDALLDIMNREPLGPEDYE